VAQFSAALATLGAYATVPTDAELAAQVQAAGGEHVLAAVLANALYGAACGAGMLAEGHMLAAGAGTEEFNLARNQVLKASGAEGPGVMGLLHWQTGQVVAPLRSLTRRHQLGPVLSAAAATAQALLVLLEACTVVDPADERVGRLGAMVTEAGEALAQAQDQLDQLRDQAADLAAALWDQ
jgi:hypothetical protein